MNLISVWTTPITVTREDWQVLVTYGLVTPELVEPAQANTENPPEFGRLHDLGNELLAASKWLTRLGRDDEVLMQMFDAIQAEAASLEPLRQFRAQIAPAVQLVLAAASGKRKDFETASPSSALLKGRTKSVADLVSSYPLDLMLEEFTAGGRQSWGLRLDNLVKRAVVELFDLFTHRPPLRRCSLCNRVFVPRGNEGNCRWHLWVWPPSVGDRPVELCNERKRFVIEGAEKDERRREYVKLHTRARRARLRYEEALQAFGARSRKTQDARRALRAATTEYENFERRRPGLKPNPVADSRDLQRKEETHG